MWNVHKEKEVRNMIKACDDCWKCSMTLMSCEWMKKKSLEYNLMNSPFRDLPHRIVECHLWVNIHNYFIQLSAFSVILLAFCDLFHHSSHKGVSLLSRKQKHLFSTRALFPAFLYVAYIKEFIIKLHIEVIVRMLS